MKMHECDCGRTACATCTERAHIESLLRDEFQALQHEMRLATPEMVWWRAQTRARADAARRVTRPILMTQAMAAAALLGVLLAIAGRLGAPLSEALGHPAALLASLRAVPIFPLLLAACGWFVVVPVMAYLVARRS